MVAPQPSTSGTAQQQAGLPTPLVAAWPRSAQWTTAFLLGITVTLLVIQGWSYLPWATRPVPLDRHSIKDYRVDLNRADKAELIQLPGVGVVLADHIITHRQDHGAFQSLE